MGRRANLRLAYLGQATGQPVSTSAIIAQICPAGTNAGSCGCSTDADAWTTVFNTSVASRLLMWPPPSTQFANCAGVSATNTTLKTGKVITAAASIATPILAATFFLGPVGWIVGIAGMIISAFGAAHARAVAAQNNALCAFVPDANTVLQTIDAGLASGSITAAQATAQYASLQSSFTAAMKAGTSYKQCDALFGYNLALQMVIAARNQDLANGVLTGGAPLPGSGASGAVSEIESAVTGAGLPPGSLPLIAALVAVWLLL